MAEDGSEKIVDFTKRREEKFNRVLPDGTKVKPYDQKREIWVEETHESGVPLRFWLLGQDEDGIDFQEHIIAQSKEELGIKLGAFQDMIFLYEESVPEEDYRQKGVGGLVDWIDLMQTVGKNVKG